MERLDRGAYAEAQALANRVAMLLRRLEGVRANLARKDGVDDWGSRGVPLRLPQVQALLDNETTLVAYRLGDPRSYVWVVASDRVETVVLPNRASIESLAEQAYRSISSRRFWKKGRGNRELCSLAETVLFPVAASIKTPRIVVVPDGALAYIPFALLPKETNVDCVERVPLLREHEVVYLPSASVLQPLRGRERPESSAARLALFADPVFEANDPRVGKTTIAIRPEQKLAGRHDGEAPQPLSLLRSSPGRLQRLTYSRREAEVIGRWMPPERRDMFLDFEAAKERVIAGDLSRHQIVHFATHGLLNDRRAGLSGVALSLVGPSGKPTDGILWGHEIRALDFSAELVVISGCQTGLGVAVRGEAVQGLAQAFMAAGARRLLVSLWRVDDRRTADLMGRFYRGLLVESMPPAAALRAAQLEAFDAGWPPVDWAGFVLQGDWRPFSFAEPS